MEIVFLPLMILNMVGGVAAAIWLIVLGDWLVLGVGIAIAFFGNWIINLALMPGMFLFGAPGMALENKGKHGGALFFAFLNAVYVAALITFWCIGTLLLLTSLAKTYSVVPLTLFAYGCATAPWAYLAQKDQQSGGNEFSNIAILFAEIAFVAMGLTNIIARPTTGILLAIFSCIMAVGVVLEMLLAVYQSRKEQRFRANS